MKKITILFTAMLISVAFASAQKVFISKGDLSQLKGQTKINVEFDYSNFGVGKFATEEEYVNKKVTDYNNKEAGKGDKWKNAWVADRESRFEPSFLELFNKYTEKAGLVASKDNDEAEYTMIVKIKFIEPGFNIYVTRKYASLNADIIFVKNSDKENPIGTLSALNMPGRTYGADDYDAGVRISEAFAKCGKDVGAFLAKKVLK